MAVFVKEGQQSAASHKTLSYVSFKYNQLPFDILRGSAISCIGKSKVKLGYIIVRSKA